MSQAVKNRAKAEGVFTSYVQDIGTQHVPDAFAVVQEYQFTEDDVELPCEAQGFSDVETDDSESVDSPTIPAAVKRRGWGHALLGVMQNAVPKRSREEKVPHLSVPRARKSVSLTPLRFGHYPLELGRRGSLGSLRR